MSDNIHSKLAKLARAVESRNLDEVSYQIGIAMREAQASATYKLVAAKGDQIEIESWPDFLNWWNNNRGQNLTYIFIDTYGANSEQVRLVKKLVSAAEKHERDLHGFYTKLRDMASQNMDVDDSNNSDSPAPGTPDVGVGGGEAAAVDEEAALDEIALDFGDG